jgi:hypothetical protein
LKNLTGKFALWFFWQIFWQTGGFRLRSVQPEVFQWRNILFLQGANLLFCSAPWADDLDFFMPCQPFLILPHPPLGSLLSPVVEPVVM